MYSYVEDDRRKGERKKSKRKKARLKFANRLGLFSDSYSCLNALTHFTTYPSCCCSCRVGWIYIYLNITAAKLPVALFFIVKKEKKKPDSRQKQLNGVRAIAAARDS